jgi:hypothetical protein
MVTFLFTDIEVTLSKSSPFPSGSSERGCATAVTNPVTFAAGASVQKSHET